MSRNRGRKYQILLSGRQIERISTALLEWGALEELTGYPMGKSLSDQMAAARDSIESQRKKIDEKRSREANGN